MCTAICRGPYCGRTLDYEFSYTEEGTIFPRNAFLPLRHEGDLSTHHALIGMAFVQEDFPLYYDAMNEHGLYGAALAFGGNAHYFPPRKGALNLASFELIPYLLGRCASLSALRALIENLNITDSPFRQDLPPSPLHWIFADTQQAVVLESTAQGLQIYENPVGVLTNNPPFPYHLQKLCEFSHLSASASADPLFPESAPYSRGMGGMGLPGDLSSSSRFIRAAFTNRLATIGESKSDQGRQFFRVLGTVEQVKGCVLLEDGQLEHTIYTACCDLENGVYFYTTHQNERIIGIDLHQEDLDGSRLISYPLLQETPMIQNAPCQKAPS